MRGAMLRERFGRVSFGKTLGLMLGLGTIVRIIGAPIAGWTYDTSGTYHPIWLVFAASFAIAAVLILMIDPHREQVN